MAIVQSLSAGESLAVGDEGEQVAEAQRRLRHLGYYAGELDGRYGDVTELAMREFQRAFSHAEDGRVGAGTWEMLEREAQFAGYDPFASHNEAEHEQGVAAEQGAGSGQMSTDGHWWWDGVEWRPMELAAAGAPATVTAGQHGGPEPGQEAQSGFRIIAVPTAAAAGHHPFATRRAIDHGTLHR